MIRVLFVCYGNICRSPMAEFMFRDMVKEEGSSPFYRTYERSAKFHDDCS